MKIIYLGHSAFRVEVDKYVLLIDPFLSANTHFTESSYSFDDATQGVTHILLTHGHDDHVGDTIAIAKKTGAQVIAVVELCLYLKAQGVENINMGNIGGTIKLDAETTITFTPAWHTSSTYINGQNTYLGTPAGLIITTKTDVIYHMCDTDIFGDMALINKIYTPTIGLVPIGDRFTMGAKTAALACSEFFNFSKIVPMHYKTFPIIDQTTDSFITHATKNGINVKNIFPLAIGESL